MRVENILNELEQIQLQKFIDDKVLQEIVKKVLLASIYSNGTLKPGEESDYSRNFAFGLLITPDGRELSQTDEQLGQRLRACVEGVKFLETGFDQLNKLKITKQEPEAEVVNQAR